MPSFETNPLWARSWVRKLRLVLAGGALVLMAACTTPENTPSSGDVFDPYEAENRKIHAFNKALDKNIVRPVALGYGAVVPDGIEDNVSHFAANLSVPGAIVNQVLQLDLPGATRNLARFSINSTLGFAGLMDIASGLGIPEDDVDFGQTLAVWGLPQGAYLELPVLGGASERDAAGKVVDYALNPLRGLAPQEAQIATGAQVAARLGQRSRFASTIDGFLYDSVDSYGAVRGAYLQRRQFELQRVGVESEEDDDLYADIFGE